MVGEYNINYTGNWGHSSRARIGESENQLDFGCVA